MCTFWAIVFDWEEDKLSLRPRTLRSLWAWLRSDPNTFDPTHMSGTIAAPAATDTGSNMTFCLCSLQNANQVLLLQLMTLFGLLLRAVNKASNQDASITRKQTSLCWPMHKFNLTSGLEKPLQYNAMRHDDVGQLSCMLKLPAK